MGRVKGTALSAILIALALALVALILLVALFRGDTLTETLKFALVLGVLAGVALTRVGAFRGKALLGTMITAPLVIPEVITGLSLLLLLPENSLSR